MVTAEKQKSEVTTSIQSLEESVYKSKIIFLTHIENNKEIPADLFSSEENYKFSL